jgi:hypothetical protein
VDSPLTAAGAARVPATASHRSVLSPFLLELEMSTEKEEVHTVAVTLKVPAGYGPPQVELVQPSALRARAGVLCECSGNAGAGSGGSCLCGGKVGGGGG